MKKILVGAIAAALLGLLAGVRSSARASGGDDLCGGCPADFRCAIVNGAPQCVPEVENPR